MRRWTVAVLIFAVAVGLTASGVALWRAQQAAVEAADRLRALPRSLTPEVGTVSASTPTTLPVASEGGTDQERADPGLTAQIRQACADITTLDQSFRPIAALSSSAGAAARSVSRYGSAGSRAAAALALADAAGEASSATRQACDALGPVADAWAAQAQQDVVLATLAEARPRLREATARLRSAETKLSAVDDAALDDSTRELLTSMRSLLPEGTARLDLLAELPGLLGFDGPTRYLILGQNTDELRPTGGFIGTAGLLTIDRGQIVGYEYGSSFAIEIPPDRRVQPPEPLRRHMDAAYWQLREANWWPDFPSSAIQARHFFSLTRPESLNGVVAIDQDFVALLLSVLGPLEVEGTGEIVTSANVRERIEYQVHVVGRGDEASRKRFVSALFSALIHRFQGASSDELRRLPWALQRALFEQHLQVWFESEPAARALSDLHWDGHLLSTGGDYLYPVSANIGANKVNQTVDQRLSYSVVEDPDGRLTGRADLRIRNRRTNPDPWPYKTADYLNFLRVYVPVGSELVSASGFESDSQAGTECGRTVFSGLVVVPPGDERTVTLEYRLPASLTPATYTLLVQKQPGTRAFPIALQGFESADRVNDLTLDRHRLFRRSGGAFATDTKLEREPGEPWHPSCEVDTSPPMLLSPPATMAIPRLDVDAEVAPLQVAADGAPQIPSNGRVAGWYLGSARPGQAGNMVVAGHVDWDLQPGIFSKLADLQPGDRVTVADTEGTRHIYAVEWVKQVNASSAPLKELVGPTTRQWLTLITCGGAFDARTRSYLDRIVVRATLVESERAYAPDEAGRSRSHVELSHR